MRERESSYVQRCSISALLYRKKDEEDIAEDVPVAKDLVSQGRWLKINAALSNFDRGDQFLTGPAHQC
jgi:hypothetical protein